MSTTTAELEKELGVALPTLPLKDVEFEATVTGLQAEVTCTQRFQNHLTTPVEAIYKFPLPDEAAILGVEMTIGSKNVVAELKKKDEAKQDYNNAVASGHHAALLTQKRPNIFEMSAGGIEPGEEVIVMIRFLQPVPWQGHGGRLTIPLVVAPRFIPGAPVERPSTGAGWSPDTDEVSDASEITPQLADEVGYKAAIMLELTPGFPAIIACPTYELMVEEAEVTAGATHKVALAGLRPDRDVVFTYVTKAEQPHVAASTAVFTPKDAALERFALVQVTPQVGTGTRPRDIVFVLDRSGSMEGAMIEGLKRVVNQTLDCLAENGVETRVGIVQYDNKIDVLVGLSPIGPEHHAQVNQLSARGSTQTVQALNEGMRLFAEADPNRERSIVLVTDGQSEGRGLNPTPGVRIYAIGVGTAVNDSSIKEFARMTGGIAETITPGEDFAGIASRFAGLTSGPVVRNLQLDNLPGATVVGLTDLFAARPTTIAIKFTGELPTNLKLTGTQTSGQRWKATVDLTTASTNSHLPVYQWAKEHLRKLADKAGEQVAASLKYGILCGRTAFVAVSLKDVPGAAPERIEVPVLLPHGWNADAFDFAYGGTRGVAHAKTLGGARTLGGSGSYNYSAGLERFGGGMRGGSTLPVMLSAGGGGPRKGYDPDNDLDGIGNRLKGIQIPASPPSPDRIKGGATKQEYTILEKFEDFLTLNKASQRPSVAHWEGLVRDLGTADFTVWSELDRARLYQILVELRDYGWKTSMPTAIKAKPTDADAFRVWSEVQKAMGVAAL